LGFCVSPVNLGVVKMNIPLFSSKDLINFRRNPALMLFKAITNNVTCKLTYSIKEATFAIKNEEQNFTDTHPENTIFYINMDKEPHIQDMVLAIDMNKKRFNVLCLQEDYYNNNHKDSIMGVVVDVFLS
jgi:hypothetical protein